MQQYLCILIYYSSVRENVQSGYNKEMCSEHLKEIEMENEKQIEQMKELNNQLKIKIAELEANLQRKDQIIDNMKLDSKEQGQRIASDILNTIFTPGQVKRLLKPTLTGLHWTTEDISSAMALRSKSGRAYKYFRDVMKIPLPCDTTLRNWSQNFSVKPGILQDVMEIMRRKGENLSINDKLTVLTFDEMYIANKVDLERREQKIYGPHKSCQFVMARGIFGNWKQPIFYEFSQRMTKSILFNIVRMLFEIGYIVVAVTNDMGSSNMSLWKDLNIGIEMSTSDENPIIKNFFIHPANETLKIFVFADVPHLIKLMRNNLLDSGFVVNSKLLGKAIFEELLILDERDLKIAFNLTRAHLDAKGFQRQS